MNTKRLLLVLASLWVSSLPLSAQTLASVSHAITHDATLATTPKNGLSGGIVDDNNSWATLLYSFYPEPHCVITDYVYFDGDSIVGGYLYKKVFMCRDELHEHIVYMGLMREENQKTYLKWNDSPEYLIYDFSLEEGMSFEYTPTGYPVTMYVKSVDFIEINGAMKKRIRITKDPNLGNIWDTWIEGIGSLDGIISFIYGNGDLRRLLLCYFQNNELIYKNPEYPKCYYEEGEDITSVQTIVNNDCYVFPNPVDDVLTVSSPNNTLLKIEIFNMFGQKVYSQAYKNTIDISFLPTGLYFLKVYDTNEQVSVFKIIKK